MAVMLLDTAVASFLHPKKRRSPQSQLYEPDLAGRTLAISFQSVAELLQWAELNHWTEAARAELDVFLTHFAVIPYELALARQWARVMAKTRSVGRRLESGDAWIAATAIYYGLPLVTHDADFRDLPLRDFKVICHAP